MSLHQPDQLYEWLETDDLVHRCEFRRRDDPTWEIEAATSSGALTVRRDGRDGPVKVVGEADVESETLIGLEADDSRGDFFTHLSAAVTSTDGRFTFRDERGAPCEMSEMRYVEFENRIYPGAVTRQRLLTAIQDVSNAVRYLAVVLENFHRFDAAPQRRERERRVEQR